MDSTQYSTKQFKSGYSNEFYEPKPSTLMIKYANWTWSKADVFDAADPSSATLYNLELHTFKPHVVVSVPGEPTAFATAAMHTWSTRIDMDVRGQSFEMKPVSKWTQKDYSFDSPALQGQKATWKASQSWTKGEAVCVTESGEVLARMQTSYWDWKKAGQLEIVGPAAQNAGLREEIVLTGFVMIYLFTLKQVGAASAGSSAAASAGAAAAASG